MINPVCLYVLQLTNSSLSTINYCWRLAESDINRCNVTIQVDPPSGRVVSGGSAWLEVVVRVGKGTREEGGFSARLVCDVEHCDHPVVMAVEGCIQVRSILVSGCLRLCCFRAINVERLITISMLWRVIANFICIKLQL